MLEQPLHTCGNCGSDDVDVVGAYCPEAPTFGSQYPCCSAICLKCGHWINAQPDARGSSRWVMEQGKAQQNKPTMGHW